MTGTRTVFLLIAWLGLAPPAAGLDDRGAVSDICHEAARHAAQRVGVPVDILTAITLNETGRSIDGQTRPWPWTVNMEGKGVWFDNAQEALAYAMSHFRRGARSFDVGCFQINYRWHGDAFASIEQMFNPRTNALYAARFLNDLYAEFGDWTRAAGAYHSRTPEFARKYEARFRRHLARLGEAPPPPPEARVADSDAGRDASDAGSAGFPFLRTTDAPRAAGSLVPLAGSPTVGRFIMVGG